MAEKDGSILGRVHQETQANGGVETLSLLDAVINGTSGVLKKVAAKIIEDRTDKHGALQTGIGKLNHAKNGVAGIRRKGK